MTPGAPPVKLLSETVMRGVPSSEKVIVVPVAVSSSVVPADRAPLLYVAPSWVQVSEMRLNSISTGLPLFQ